MKPTITFLLPSHSKYPVGGFKVVYEYANRFVREGYDIRIVYPATVFFNGENFINKIKSALRYVYYKANNQYSPYHWFDLDKKVKIFWVPSLDQKHIPDSDVIVATSAETAERLDNFVCSAKKIYFIQGYETWFNGEERFLETLDFGLTKIVVSPHLLKVVESRGQKAELILNGFDFNYFKKTVDVEDRNKYQIAMLFHLSSAKGCDDGLKALAIVRDKFPLLKASFFGYPERPKNLPSWIKYIQTPDKDLHNKIYNEAAIFIGTSYSEGWGLTVGEAMICGCAVACTNIDGFNIMAKDEDTALLNEPGDFQSMAENIIRLIDNDKMRYQIAKKGSNAIQNYKWDESYNIFKKMVKIK